MPGKGWSEAPPSGLGAPSRRIWQLITRFGENRRNELAGASIALTTAIFLERPSESEAPWKVRFGSTPPMILVTGAAGKTGLAVIRALTAKGGAIRALVHRPEQIRSVRAAGAHEAAAGDMGDPAVLARAAHGARAVYHICPNMTRDEVAIGQGVTSAARSAGVQHFVYHSVLHPQIQAMPHHWNKLHVEALILESGLDYTILQPTSYMQNVLVGWSRLVEKGVHAVPYSTGTRLGMVDLDDVAEAAGVVLTEPGHAGATYELAGAEVLTQTEVAEVLSRQLGRPVRAERVTIPDWLEGARASGMREYQIDTLVKMFRHYESHGFWGNPRVLTQLLGRRPTSFAAFVERTRRERRGV